MIWSCKCPWVNKSMEVAHAHERLQNWVPKKNFFSNDHQNSWWLGVHCKDLDTYYVYVNLLDQQHLAANIRSKTAERIVALLLLVRPQEQTSIMEKKKTLEIKLSNLCWNGNKSLLQMEIIWYINRKGLPFQLHSIQPFSRLVTWILFSEMQHVTTPGPWSQ